MAVGFAALLALGAPAAQAAKANHQHYAACFQYVGHFYHISPKLLRAIAEHESRLDAHAVARNSNGSYDIGLMQINSSWLPKLKRLGVTVERLVNEPCLNVAVGAAILSSNIKQYGATWKAVGAYNAVTPSKRRRYELAIAHRLLADAKED